ncbi:peptidylprolyl isomerase [Amaricoccus solimangrovi]|uniref:Parvulin-like PPIase n=1 Tax=Amaricoccus solimangrovi TaxID=2589815 RepID=A0A501WYW0_9RHOB|nr:peptidylprolyl isomerase [Amaricoccus solimangrovi]TPE52241.1 peptidylprolyl isomerase [Amaricoccus solimangrovi]
MRNLLIAGLLASAALVPGAYAQDAEAAKPADAAKTANYDVNTVVATVNGTDITLGNVVAMRERLPAQYQQLPDETLMSGLVQQLADQLVLADSVSANPDEDPLAVKLQLENDRRAALANIVADKAMSAPVSDEAVKAAYDEQVKDFQPAPEYDASHILVKTEDEAKKLLDDINGGADFAQVAKDNSTDGSAQQGGELGWFGKGQMVPEFETAVVDMKKGEVSGPIQTQFGWHLIKLNDTRESSPPSLEESRPQIEQQLRQKAFQDQLEKLRAAANIEIKAAAVPAAAIRDNDLLN